MTTYVAARDTLVTKINTALSTDYPSLKVFWENTTQVDVNTVGNSFLQVEINFHNAINTTVNDDPLKQIIGEVNLRLFYKEGQGTRSALAMFDYLTTLMKYQTVSGVTLNTPKPGKKINKDGWASFDLNCPFFFRA